MKRTILATLLTISILVTKGQTYVSLMPGFYTGQGTVKQRTTFDIEVGKQWDAFSLGLDLGKTNIDKCNGADTTTYFEFRPNLNVFQQGKFANTLTIGLGYVFGASNNVMTELSSGIQYTPKQKWSYNLYFGTYYFSGNYASTSNNFLGLSIMYYFKKTENKALFSAK